MKIAILGAGHGGCAAAVDLTIRGFEVSLYNRSASTIQPLVDLGGVRSLGGVYGDRFVPVPKITTDIEVAVEGAEVLMVTVPSTAHEYYATALAPFISAEQIVLLNPGHTGGALEFDAVLRRNGVSGPVRCCETQTLAYVSRKQTPDTVSVFKVASQDFGFAAFPGKVQHELADVIRQIYPAIEPLTNVLETGLRNGNAVLHPPGMVMNAGWIEFTDGDFMYYAEGVTPAVAAVLGDLDRERIEIMTSLGLEAKTFERYFYDQGYTTEEAFQSGSIYRVVQESPPNKTIKAPSSLDDRYLHEDVGYGLVPMSALGDLIGVETRTMKALTHLASLATGVDYASSGRTLEKMGLERLDPSQLDGYLYEGTQRAPDRSE